MKHRFRLLLFLLILSLLCGGRGSAGDTSSALSAVDPVDSGLRWKGYTLFIWPYGTDVLRDHERYRGIGVRGFQIDRGAGQAEKVRFSRAHDFVYYAGHVADKGYLHLTGADRKAVTGKRDLLVRPESLADPQVLAQMKGHMEKNIAAVRGGNVLAYALDDEISLGTLTNPADLDVHPRSVEGFRRWLNAEYKTIEALNRQWGRRYPDFEHVKPVGFESIRGNLNRTRLSGWNLSPWMDFRDYMDTQFASVLSDLVRYANHLDPKTPAGIVGGQAPSPWGGYDYAKLCRALQWMEAYDIHSTNEIIRSFWKTERRPRVHTFFSTKNPKLDTWFFWYYLLHGDSGAVLWPDGWFPGPGGEIAPHVKALEGTFREVQGEIGQIFADPKAEIITDPIGIYYSQPSIRAAWVMDALTHGRTWPNRKSSLDNRNQSAGILRNVWCKTLEDLGFQYDFIDYLDVREKKVDLGEYRVIILPKTLCLSDEAAASLRDFVEQGGTLIADYMCGLLDEHGKSRKRGALDDLFGLERKDEAGYLDGKTLTEIDGEKYNLPFLQRFTGYEDAARIEGGIPVVERGTVTAGSSAGVAVNQAKTVGKGRAVYLNLSPLEYRSPKRRFGTYGSQWRGIVRSLLKSAGLVPRVEIYENGRSENMIETIWWKKEGRRYLGLIKNPTLEKAAQKVGSGDEITGITGPDVMIRLAFSDPVRLVNLRTKERPDAEEQKIFTDHFSPWEANIYEVVSKDRAMETMP